MSTTSFLLRSRSTSPENSDDERPKAIRRHSRRDVLYEPDRLRYFRRVSRTRCILISISLFTFLLCFLTKGPIGPPYLSGKCQLAILLEGIPPTPTPTGGMSQPDWVNGEDAISLEDKSSWARVTSPEELMGMLERGVTPSPKIIHQSWKDRQLPQNFEKWGQEWQKLHDADWR